MRRSVLLVAMLAAAIGTPMAGSAESRDRAVVTDVGDACDPLVPAALAPMLPGSPELRLRVQLLVEGVPAGRVRAIERSMRDAYGQAGVKLFVSTRRIAGLKGEDALSLLDQIRPAHRARRDTDATHLLTFRDLTYEGSKNLVGLADCIGGIATPDRALSVSEVTPGLDDANLVYEYGAGTGDAAANVATHELGHVLGARHEHADCASGAAAPDPAEPVATPCSVMFLAAPTSGVFGPVEKAVLRGYVSSFVPQP